MSNASRPTFRELALDWRIWLGLMVCVLIGTAAWLLGYD